MKPAVLHNMPTRRMVSPSFMCKVSGWSLIPIGALLLTGCGLSSPLLPGGQGGSGPGGTGGRTPSVDGGAEEFCHVGDLAYPSGTTNIAAPDGCNICSCDHGQLACTLRGCFPAQTCGGLLGVACAKGQFCQFAPSARCGAGDQTGQCVPTGGACTDEYAPVCGCDLKTYPNACTAAANGVSVAENRACGTAPGSCVLDGVTYPDGTGSIPASDGCNICACAGGALRCTLRACPVPRACGARAGSSCGATEYCAYTDGQYCGAADAESVCKARPILCPTIFSPVCGCDNKTYGSGCEAAMAGSGVLHAGPCASGPRGCVVGGVTYPHGAGGIPAADGCNTCSCADGQLACTLKACTTPKMCGGFAGLTCPATEYCDYVPGQFCGAADASSTCKKRPEACIALFDPVCGCDGKTYSNSCEAAGAGVGYSNKGYCP